MLNKIKKFFHDINEFFKDIVTLKFEGYDYETLENNLIKVKDEFESIQDVLMTNKNLTKEEFEKIFIRYKSLSVSLDELEKLKVSSDYIDKFAKELIVKYLLNLLISVLLIVLNFPLGMFVVYLNYLFLTVNGEAYAKEDKKLDNYLDLTIEVATKLSIMNGNIARLLTKQNELINHSYLEKNKLINSKSIEENLGSEAEKLKEREKCLKISKTK